MMIPNLPELRLYPVESRGVPNAERIPIQVQIATDMGRYGMMVGYSGTQNFTMPFHDNLYWFGGGLVNPGDWILLFTGRGEAKTDTWSNPPGSKIYTAHWGRPRTMFANSMIVPLLFRTDAVDIGLPPGDVPQLGAPNG